MQKSIGYAAFDEKSPLKTFHFERRDLKPNDVLIDIQYCGVCHSDLHQVRNEWGGSIYPMVPGHEIVGKVTSIGSKVERFKVGDLAAVGCLVGSCRTCPNCHDGLEQFCQNGFVGTYNGREPGSTLPTYGGYANNIVVDENFTLRVPKNLDLARVAPLLCAGITTYSPLRHWKVGPGQKVGIIGLGGLGHMGVKFAHAFGAAVTVFTHSGKKVDDAKRLGASAVVVSTDAEQMKRVWGQFDFILDTVSADHDVNAYLRCLKRDGAMVMVGLPENPPTVEPINLIFGRKSLSGSLIGGIRETQEMLDYCGTQKIESDIEVIQMSQINEAYERMLRGDVRYRFVIDLKTLK